jgi:hypothetical protein
MENIFKKEKKTSDLKKYFKEYYLKNIDYFLEKSIKNRVYIECKVCNCSIQKKCISSHKLTKKHKLNETKLSIADII